MKFLLIGLTALCFMLNSTANAQEFRPFKDIMKEMGAQQKVLAFGILRKVDLENNPLEALSQLSENAEALFALTTEASQNTPWLDKVPAELRATAEEQFNELITLAEELKNAVAENNELVATQKFQAISMLQREGHGLFKKN